MKEQIIFLAPMQLRKELALGNIYSALVADMYRKVLQILGFETYFPLTINVVGKKTEDLLSSLKVDLSDKYKLEENINFFVKKTEQKYKLYYINFDSVIRDDLLVFQDSEIITNFNYAIRDIILKKCLNCNKNYGTDLSLLRCNECGEVFVESKEKRLSIEVDNLLLLKQLEKIEFVPKNKKAKFTEIIRSFPEKCVFCLEKERTLTTYFQGRPLDPKLVALQSLIFTKANSGFLNSETVFFQGDVLKKFTYYSFAYLGSQFLPRKVVCHGLILGSDNKKLRSDDFSSVYLDSLSPKLLRAFLLSFQVGNDVKFSTLSFDSKAVGLIRILNKIKTMLGYKIHNSLSAQFFLKEEFISSVTNLNYALAYQYFSCLINKYWIATRSEKCLHEDDRIWLRQVSQLYFGSI